MWLTGIGVDLVGLQRRIVLEGNPGLEHFFQLGPLERRHVYTRV